MNYENCPNCNKSLNGFFSADLLLESKVEFINKHLKQDKGAYCSNCSKPLLKQIADKFRKEKVDIERRLQQIIHYIPIMTSPSPVNWDYEVLGMISAQTTSGTGFATELSRSFNDFFGSGSQTTNRKIGRATNLCKADLRVQAVRHGGNAVISTDIDFNEIGAGTTNMLMVCMAGTAIRVTNMENFSAKNRDTIIEVVELTEKLEAIATEIK
ncbi:YbjQ family protein [Tenacibaculum haliotis]|uniref:YbjQ family protein n=1 Tax=Tenacibaculum haliotis TaxID=1888914 RepID=UPI0021AE604C|nr:YbjQ family protein [Tenacibaculum haliotis]MCT4697606.1 YbjQ family protein [Tenacibaculum haliotis]